MKKQFEFIVGSVVFGVLLLLAGVFYIERTTFIDIPFHLFEILRTNDFAIQNFRFIAFFTQLFPLLGARVGLSLQQIALLYSMSFIVLYMLTFFVILLRFKDKKTALAYLLFNVLMTTHTFYWIQSELTQGVAILFIYIATLLHQLKTEPTQRYAYFLASAVGIFVIVFAHPLLIFAMVFVFVFFSIKYTEYRKTLIFNFIAYIIIYVIKAKFFKTAYDSQAMEGLKRSGAALQNYFELTATRNFLHYCITDYYFLLLGLIGIIWFYVKNKKTLALGLVLISFVGYSFLINITYPNGANQFYLENQYLILAIFIIFPLVFDVFSEQEGLQKYKNTFVLFVCLVGLVRITFAHQLYTQRVGWLQHILTLTTNEEHKKLIIKKEDAPLDTLLLTWASSYEFWLLSTIQTGESRTIIIQENDDEFLNNMAQTNVFIGKWATFKYEDLPKNYFRFYDNDSYQLFKK